MEQRSEALREALNTNAEETTRWEKYLGENEQAIENLELFGKRLAVDVMVPIGRKAYTPGQLIHTNEVMVGHYQGYFSKCSAFTAKLILEHRIEMAKEHLEKLKLEQELWQNKLEKPYLEGVLPDAEQREIIEDYDEEKEKRWREEHKLRLKQAKLREKQELEREIKDKEAKEHDMEQEIEESAMMEELEAELDKLEVDGNSDELLKQLMSGNMTLPPTKPRVAHTAKPIKLKLTPLQESCVQLQGVVKKIEVQTNSPPTNNNFCVNSELLAADNAVDGNVSDDSTDSELPDEVKIIEEQASFLSAADKIGFYQYQLQIIEKKLLSCCVSNANEIEKKLHLFQVRDHLEELFEMVEQVEGAEELAAANEMLAEEEVTQQTDVVATKSRRISFALEDHTMEFHKNETVAEMLPKLEEKVTKSRDVIKLDEQPTMHTKIIHTVDKKQLILDKVEQNVQFVSEHQSKQDFDLVNKIIGNAVSTARTFHIGFKHSTLLEHAITSKEMENALTMPGTPADLYRLVMPLSTEQMPEPITLFVDAYEGEELVKTPVLKEQDHKEAFKDMRTEFSNPGSSVDKLSATLVETGIEKNSISNTKSILRNKSAIEVKTHMLDDIENQMNKANTNKKKKPKQQAVNKEEDMSAYNKVMHDVVEKPLLTEPEPLPEGKYIDAHAPKKRISRFKKMRGGVDKT